MKKFEKGKVYMSTKGNLYYMTIVEFVREYNRVYIDLMDDSGGCYW